jgi:DNA-directed RNA polymerase II subunit RPB11
MNAPAPTDHILLEGDEQKVKYAKDTQMTNAGSFEVRKEDHTLGNIMRMSLLRDKRVIFAGYRIPHPLEHVVFIKVRTKPTCDPITAMTTSITNLKDELASLADQFRTQVQDHRETAEYRNLDYHM